MITASKYGIHKGFGYSLSKYPVDVDNNDCKDFAIGSPFAEKVILFKSLKVITLQTNVELKLENGGNIIDPKAGGKIERLRE